MNSVFLGIFLLLIGGGLLYFTGNLLVKGSSSFALRHGVSQFVVGLTIVAFGTSAPEFFVSFIAALKGSDAISIGNIIGSNIANTSLVFGLAILIFEKSKIIHLKIREMYFFIGGSFVLYLFCSFGVINRLAGLILFSAFILFIYFCLNSKRVKSLEEDVNILKSRWREILFILVGTLGLPIAAYIFVQGGVTVARAMGISELFIGVTVMALGTSLPELAASLVAAIRRNPQLSIGNIIGSNVFNMMGVLGFVGLVNPINVDRRVLSLDLPLMCFLALFMYFVTRRNLKHYQGVVLLVIYIGYVTLAFIRS